MKKSSMMFKVICLAVCLMLSLSALPAMAEEVVEETADETVAEPVEDVTEAEAVEESTEDAVESEEATEEVVEEEIEVVDLFTATLRDGGVYVTPGESNAAVFTHDSLRYRVEAGSGNLIKLDGFESDVTIHDEIAETEKNRIQANGEITTDAAHSGYFGLSVYTGDVVYRTAVSEGDAYVFSAWFKMQSGSIDDDDRAFKVVAENGDEYIVGWNEIGREVDATGSWQQIIFTFKAPKTGLFQMDFNYKGNALFIDDLELYDTEVFLNPIEITDVKCYYNEVGGEEFDPKEGFDRADGYIYHTLKVYNHDEDDVFFTAVMVVYKDGEFDGASFVHDYALVNDETEIELAHYIFDESGDAEGYSYMVYLFNDTDYTQIYGEVPSRENPYVVYGH